MRVSFLHPPLHVVKVCAKSNAGLPSWNGVTLRIVKYRRFVFLHGNTPLSVRHLTSHINSDARACALPPVMWDR